MPGALATSGLSFATLLNGLATNHSASCHQTSSDWVLTSWPLAKMLETVTQAHGLICYPYPWIVPLREATGSWSEQARLPKWATGSWSEEAQLPRRATGSWSEEAQLPKRATGSSDKHSNRFGPNVARRADESCEPWITCVSPRIGQTRYDGVAPVARRDGPVDLGAFIRVASRQHSRTVL